MLASFHNSFVSKILPVTLFNPRFSKKFFPYPADCNRSPGEGGALILTYYEYRVPRCQHIKTNGTQCGSPALRNGEYCYFHRRWRMTTVDLSHSAHHVTTEFVLPVLEDADSIQITLGQIMRMIVCRQVDTKSAGLLLYGLQIASANLRRTGFEPYHRNVLVDCFRVPESIIGDEAWSPADFANVGNVGRAPSPAKPSPTKEPDVGRTPSSAKGSLPDKRSDLAKLPSSAKESCAAPTPPEPQPKAPSPATQPAPASNVPTSSLPSATEQRELQKAERAMAGALKGDWRDVKTLFEFAGIFPPKDNTPATDP